MLIHQLQMDRLSKKFASLAANQGPELQTKPLMAIQSPQLFSEVVKKKSTRVWRAQSKQYPIESRRSLIQHKLDEIRSKSTTKNPMCIRCGSVGHLAAHCRNAQLCFVCNKFGHKSMFCKKSTDIYPFTPPKATTAPVLSNRIPIPPPDLLFPQQIGRAHV